MILKIDELKSAKRVDGSMGAKLTALSIIQYLFYTIN